MWAWRDGGFLLENCPGRRLAFADPKVSFPKSIP